MFDSQPQAPRCFRRTSISIPKETTSRFGIPSSSAIKPTPQESFSKDGSYSPLGGGTSACAMLTTESQFLRPGAPGTHRMPLGRTRTYNPTSLQAFISARASERGGNAREQCRRWTVGDTDRNCMNMTRFQAAYETQSCNYSFPQLLDKALLGLLGPCAWSITFAGSGPTKRVELNGALPDSCKAVRILATPPQHRKDVLLTSNPAVGDRLTFRPRIVETAYTALSSFRQDRNKLFSPFHSVRSLVNTCDPCRNKDCECREKVGFSPSLGLTHVGPCGGKRDGEQPVKSVEIFEKAIGFLLYKSLLQ